MYRKYYFIILLLLASSLSAGTRTVFSGTGGIEDTWLDRLNTSTIYSSADTIYVQNAFAAFSVSVVRSLNINDTIPTTATVTHCTLYVYVKNITGTKQIETGKICKPWIDSQTKHTTWKSFLGGWGVDPVNSAGTDCAVCNNTTNNGGVDYVGPVGTSALFSSAGWVAFPVDTCHANAWVSGDDTNNGVRLWDNATGGDYTPFSMYSSEDGTNSPEFVFVWEEASTGVPQQRYGGVRHSGDGATARHGG